jgi:hypothetical protein
VGDVKMLENGSRERWKDVPAERLSNVYIESQFTETRLENT